MAEPLKKDLPGGGAILYRKPEFSDYARAMALRQSYANAFWATELGRRLYERVQAGEAISLAALQSSASLEEQEAYAVLSEWKVPAVLKLVTGLEGIEQDGPVDIWLMRKHYRTVSELGNELFGESE